jgi:hypothetical protein
MPKITTIEEQFHDPDRLSIFIDGTFCAGVRKRTFQATGLKVGDEITCEELKGKENFVWKQLYGKPAWKKEKVRIEKVSDLIKKTNENALVKIVGFGADSEELIKEHPEEKGKPDIDIMHKEKPDTTLIKVEVTGTERMREGSDYWVRPDKLEYAENHPDEDVWIVLHYALPSEKFVFIRPTKGKIYPRVKHEINKAGEIYCDFSDTDEEVKTYKEFSEHLKSKLGSGAVAKPLF